MFIAFFESKFTWKETDEISEVILLVRFRHACSLDRSKVLWKVSNLLAADLLHHLLQLGLENRDGVVAASASECGCAVHEGSTKESEFRAARQSSGDVGAGTDAAVHHNCDLITAFVCD